MQVSKAIRTSSFFDKKSEILAASSMLFNPPIFCSSVFCKERRSGSTITVQTIQDSHPSVVIVAIEQHRIQQHLLSTTYNSFENIKKQYDHCRLLGSSSSTNNRLLLREIQSDILIIAGLIVKRKTELSVKIQTTWRKEAARNRFCIYKQLLWHQCKLKHTRVILFQNCYRGFVGRELKRTLQSQHAKMKLMESYKAERRQNKKLREYAMSREVIQRTYVKAVAKDRLLRYMNGYRTSSS